MRPIRWAVSVHTTAFLVAAGTVAGQAAPAWARGPDPHADHIRLIVRADDLGSTHASILAMQRAFASGIVTSGSILTTTPWLSEAADVVAAHPEWSIGLHLALTSEWDRFRWYPVAPPERVPSLVAEDGALYHSYPNSPLALQWLKHPPYLTSMDKEEMPAAIMERRKRLTSPVLPEAGEVETELRAQIARARRLGIRVDYLDCHMGVACDPALAPVLIKLAAELCVPIPEEGWMGYTPLAPPLGDDLPARVADFVGRLKALKPGLYRVVIEPTVDDEEARSIDDYFGPNWARGGEISLDVLEAPEVREVIRTKSIELVSVRDLWDYESCKLRD